MKRLVILGGGESGAGAARLGKKLGYEVLPKIVQTENFNFRSAPTDINTPSIRLYPLLESMSGRVDLKMPGITFTSYTDKYVMPRFEQSFNVTYK